MLRFGNIAAQRGGRTPQHAPRSLWLLIAMLGMVAVMMQQLATPEAAALLGSLFAAEAPSPPSSELLESSGSAAPDRADLHPSAEPAAAAEVDGPWAAVKDNALFSSAEQAAWFLLFERAREASPGELAAQSAGEVAYAQLAGQPNVYRARVITARGRVLRESQKRAPDNTMGIESYHQLWLAPRGGGEWPIVVYALKLPMGFPRGDGIAADVTVHGLFFKNWSFPYEGGMGVAPVVVTHSFDWQPPLAPKPAQPVAAVDGRGALVGLVIAAVAAAAFVAWAVRQTRRPRVAHGDGPVDLTRLEVDP